MKELQSNGVLLGVRKILWGPSMWGRGKEEEGRSGEVDGTMVGGRKNRKERKRRAEGKCQKCEWYSMENEERFFPLNIM